MLNHVPPDLLTRALCKLAVDASVREACGLAPHELMGSDRESLRIAGNLNYAPVEPVLRMVPPEWRDESLCQSAIEASPENAEFVPETVWSLALAQYLGQRGRDDQYAKFVPLVLRDAFFDAGYASNEVSAPRSPPSRGMR